MGNLRGWGAGSAFLLAEETQGNTNCQHNGRKVCFLSFLRREKLKSQQRRPPFPLQEGTEDAGWGTVTAGGVRGDTKAGVEGLHWLLMMLI